MLNRGQNQLLSGGLRCGPVFIHRTINILESRNADAESGSSADSVGPDWK